MDFDEFSDDEDREAKMYAMLHFVDSEVADRHVPVNEMYQEKENINTNKCIPELIISNVEIENVNPSKKGEDLDMFGDCFVDMCKNNDLPNLEPLNKGNTYEPSTTNNVNSLKNNSGFENSKKKVSHAGRYWATGIETTRNSTFQKINKPVFKATSTARIAAKRKSGSVITLIDKRTTKRKTSESSSLVTNSDDLINSQLELIQAEDDSVQYVSKSPQPICKASNKSTKPIAKKSTQTPNKKSKRVSTPNKGQDDYTSPPSVSKTASSQNTNLRSYTAKKVRSEREKFLAEISLKRKLTKAKKVQKTKSFIEKCSIITLESSDDDSVVEVELPPVLPTTIDLESSDEGLPDQVNVNAPEVSIMSTSSTQTDCNNAHQRISERVTCISPVPSVISSVSDDFIEGDCSSLNISRGNDSSILTFNFGLHGTDLCDIPVDNTPNKSSKKSKKSCSTCTESEEIIQKTTSALTTLAESSDKFFCNADSSKDTSPAGSECFATPKSKIRKRRNSKPKSYTVPDQAYVTPSIDVYESESSDIPESVIDVPVTPVSKRNRKSFSEEFSKDSTLDSTADITDACCPSDIVEDSLVMANVIGLHSSNSIIDIDDDVTSVCDENLQVNEVTSPSIKKQHSKSSKTRKKTAVEMCIKQMHKYYNTNWGTDFDHIKLKQEMPKEKEHWQLDATDRGRPRKAQIICGYCNKTGHRSDKCYKKPKVCSMCGEVGHLYLRCPNKICLGCGNNNHSFSSSCDNCKRWRNIRCVICEDYGHPPQRCPDVWRRYHLTITNEIPLIQDKRRKPNSQLFCSGCAKRGHLITNCQNYIAFSEFTPPSPFVFSYTPQYTPDGVRTPVRDPSLGSGSGGGVLGAEIKARTVPISGPQSPGKRKPQKISTPIVSEPISSVPLNIVEINTNLEKQTIPTKPDIKSSSIGFNVTNESESLLNKFSSLKQPNSDSTRKVVDLLNDDSELLFHFEQNSEKNDLDTQKANVNTLRKEENLCLNLVEAKQLVSTDLDTITKTNNLNPINPNEKNNSTSHILLTKEHAIKLDSNQGVEYIKLLSKKYNIGAQKCTLKLGASLVLTGEVDKHLDFQSDLQNWISGDNNLVPQTPNLTNNLIPKKVKHAVRFVSDDIEKLKQNLGKPWNIHQSILQIEQSISKCGSKKKVNGTQYSKLCKQVTKNRRKLNMILLGQAGLCDGNYKLNRLKSIIVELKTSKCVSLSIELREEMRECYDYIFSGTPRDDYVELIGQYKSGKIEHPTKGFIPKQLVIQKVPLNNEKKALLVRLQAILHKLHNISTHWNHNPYFKNSLDFLSDCKRRILHDSVSRAAMLLIRREVDSTHKFLLSFNANTNRI